MELRMKNIKVLLILSIILFYPASNTFAQQPEKVYSIAQRKRKFAPYIGWGYAWNLFFPKEQSTIRIDGVNIQVENVTPNEIRIRV